MNSYIHKAWRIVYLLMLIIYGQQSYSQGFKVKEFSQNVSDGSAFHAPLGPDGHQCGLIKVRTDDAMLQFRGDVVGEVENKMNEYWVYMPQGSNQLRILHPNFLPMTVVFSGYGIAGIDPKHTYILTLSPKKYKKEKCGLVVTVKPESAVFSVDGIPIENLSGNGYYQLYLPKGDHICRAEQKGFRPFVQAAATGKGTQYMNAELESVMAELEVRCRTETADIYVDGELKGNGQWKGTVFAGNHNIEARQQNFISSSQTVSIAEKESRTFVIPQLKRAKGKVRIETIPSNLPVKIDDEDVGISPCTVDVETGAHYVTCKFYGLKLCRKEFVLSQNALETIRLKMEYGGDDLYGEISDYIKAYNGDMESIEFLAYSNMLNGSEEKALEAVYWFEKCSNVDNLFYNERYDFKKEHWIDAFCWAGKPEKALEVFPIIKKSLANSGHYFPSFLYLENIGESFLKKKEYDKAIMCFSKANQEAPSYSPAEGLEGLGDCYRAIGNKQLAVAYYRKWLNIECGKDPAFRSETTRERIEKKLKELGY